MRRFITRRAAPIFLSLLLCALLTVDPAAQQSPSPASSVVDDPSLVDVTGATIVTPASLNVQERTAVRILVEEIAKRTNVRLPVSAQWPADTVAAMASVSPARR